MPLTDEQVDARRDLVRKEILEMDWLDGFLPAALSILTSSLLMAARHPRLAPPVVFVEAADCAERAVGSILAEAESRKLSRAYIVRMVGQHLISVADVNEKKLAEFLKAREAKP